jgi:DNA-binding NtrC family response regulator
MNSATSLAPSDRRRSILLVDDEPLIRLDLIDFFTDEGFEVFEARDADHAIAVLEANSAIQIVVTDVQMPGSMDGIRLAHAIRHRWPPTLLIVVSGAAASSKAQLPSDALFIAKPLDPHFLLGEIDRMMA